MKGVLAARSPGKVRAFFLVVNQCGLPSPKAHNVLHKTAKPQETQAPTLMQLLQGFEVEGRASGGASDGLTDCLWLTLTAAGFQPIGVDILSLSA